MLDINYIRDNAAKVKQVAKDKNIDIDVDGLLAIDKNKRELQTKIDDFQNKRNKLAKTLQEGKPSSEKIAEGKALKEAVKKAEIDFNKLQEDYLDLMAKVPQIPSEDTPIGKDEKGNVEVYRWGEPPKFDFKPLSYLELGKKLDLLDCKRGVKISGYRGYYVKNEAVTLQLGLMFYALRKLIAKGFTPMIPPTLVRSFALFGSGYFSGREYDAQVDEVYKIANSEKLADGTTGKEDKFLVGTAEPSLLAYYAGEILEEKRLPLKMVGFSQCYRSEIGSYGKDTKGIYRVHEFMKVEQVCFVKADLAEAEKMHQEMIAISKELHEELKLPYRQLQICTGDMGVGKYKMYDLEAWIPSRNSYGETGSASSFLDWQARRLRIKYRNQKGDKKYPYLLNNTALASARTLIAIMENYQQKDGSIEVPEVLREFVGKTKIEGK
ncbi:MAG: serine--tRNA ligase [Patescibacteria group bacterium]|nr:serine--tRNA ligase [Patescibacteria group bacterium]